MNSTKKQYTLGCFLIIFSCLLYGQDPVTWIGITSNWEDTANWDKGVVPSLGTEVIIPAAGVAVMPIISNGVIANAKSVKMQGSTLTIDDGGILTINGIFNFSGKHGLLMEHADSDIQVNGQLIIVNSVENGLHMNAGSITVGVEGVLDIVGTEFGPGKAIEIVQGSILNNGKVNLNTGTNEGLNMQVGTAAKQFVNNGQLSLKHFWSDGIALSDGANFNNTANGSILIQITNTSVGDGAINLTAGGSKVFDNFGTITISYVDVVGIALSNNTNTGSATFNNRESGTIDISSIGYDGIYLLGDGNKTFVNKGNIKIKEAKDGFGILMENNSGIDTAKFNNMGLVNISNTEEDGIATLGMGLKIINNSDTIHIAGISDGINLNNEDENGIATFNNEAGSLLTISDTNDDGIDSSEDGGQYLFNNAGTIQITDIEDTGITDVLFTNKTGGKITGNGRIEANFFISEAGSIIAPGTSAGRFRFLGDEDFSNTILNIEIDGTSGAGAPNGHDQLRVNGDITITDATLNLSGVINAIDPADAFMILRNSGDNPVVGTFKGLAEGALINLNSFILQISYVGGNGNDIVLSYYPSISVPVKVFLEGPYNSGTLSTNLDAVMDLTEPYTSLGFTLQNANTTVPDRDFLTNNQIVDWVVLALRSDQTTEVAARAVLLKSDGTLMDENGHTPILFEDLAADDYYIVIYHYNHLGIMSSVPHALSNASTLYDFTNSASAAFGTSAQSTTDEGFFAMPSGDGDGNGDINALDFVSVWIPNNGQPYVYLASGRADYNLDGSIDALDFVQHWVNNNSKISQIP